MTDSEPRIPHDLSRQFNLLIKGRSGLYFQDHDLKGLEDAIRSRMKSTQISSPEKYYLTLTSFSEKDDEFRELLNLLTINHTYFFRNQAHFNALQKEILPSVIDKKKRMAQQNKEVPSLRIWSAGCSSGEEPYSIAMLILDLIEDLTQWDIRIHASDVSNHALEKAKMGVYSSHALRVVESRYKDRYFEEDTSTRVSQYRLSPKIKQMVSFDYFNLMDDQFPTEFDIILCRNVLIYFETPTIIDVIEKFYESLDANGYLFIGYSETLHFISDKFRMEEFENGIFYRKRSLLADSPPVQQPEKDVEWEEVLKVEGSDPAPVSIEKTSEDRKEEKSSEGLYEDIMKKVHYKEYQDALSLINTAFENGLESVDLHYVAAEIYSSLGDFVKARDQLDKTTRMDPLYAPAHYLMGSIAMEEGQDEVAKKSLKKSLYIDSQFPLARFALAMIYKRENNITQAIREYRNTLEVLSGQHKDSVIAYSGNLTVSSVMGVCTDNIERLKTL